MLLGCYAHGNGALPDGKVLNCAMVICTIQRNARVYGELRDWPWWQPYTKVRSLLTATRNDEELRRKELELAAIKERAQREKEVLESLKMISEAEKWKVEESLEAERVLSIDKDSLLDRSRKRELEDDVAALQADLDTLGSQLDRAMANHKATEEKYETLRVAFEEATEHLVRFKQSKRRGSSSTKSCFKACKSRKRRLKIYSLSGMSFVNCQKTPRDG